MVQINNIFSCLAKERKILWNYLVICILKRKNSRMLDTQIGLELKVRLQQAVFNPGFSSLFG